MVVFCFTSRIQRTTIFNFINPIITFTKEINDKELPFVDILINPFLANIPILHTLKTPENQSFSDVFRGYKIGTVAKKWGKRNHDKIWMDISFKLTDTHQYLFFNPVMRVIVIKHTIFSYFI